MSRRTQALILGCGLVLTTTTAHEAAGRQGAGDPSASVSAVVEAFNASGQDLISEVSRRGGNVAISPYSIGTAMAMALSGARGSTETEMMAVLRHRLTRPAIDLANTEIIQRLNAIAVGPGPSAVTLQVAGALMTTGDGARISPAYAATLQDKYAADLLTNATVATVNAWAAAKTAGKIDRILDRLDAGVVAVLVNAIYFKAPWATAFDKRATRDGEFSVSAAQRVAVPMMHAQGRFALARRPGFRAIRLPYSGGGLAMIVVLPDEGSAAVGPGIPPDALRAIGPAGTSEAEILVDLQMPRFKVNFSVNLEMVFQRLGMRQAFNMAEADFSGITGRPPRDVPMAIDRIVHRAVIEVSEEGTEAAAVTAIGTRTTTALRVQPEPFHVNRPFVFYIVDGGTGAVLFQGRIADPRGE